MCYYRGMWRKLRGYSLISVVSFCFFTLLFHTVAGAQSARIPLIPTPAILAASLSPTPTSLPSATPTQPPPPTLIPTAIPSATPTPQPTIAVVSDTESLFSRFSDEYHVDKELLKRVARCESGFNPQAENGPYRGMFQFLGQTWTTVRTTMGLDSNPDLRTNAEEAIRTAAYMFSHGQAYAWAGCE